MMSSAKHYLDFELKEPEIDAAVDVIDASDALNSTGMEINEKRTKTLAERIAKQLKSR
jgi:selenocysteine lyase/cysteine desulfurase